MNNVQQRAAAKHFAEYWKGKGYEKGESQKFWLALLGDVFGVEHAGEYISFEDQVHLDHTSFIDGYIPATHVLIEQKGIGKDLKKPIKQSDGTLLTPRQQAQRYIHALLDEKGRDAVPKWVVICNFAEFHIYDIMEYLSVSICRFKQQISLITPASFITQTTRKAPPPSKRRFQNAIP